MALPTPLHHWRLNETSGTTAADAQGGPAATAMNGLTMGGLDALPSLGGKAVLLDGVDDYLQLSTGPILAGLSTWTVGVQVKNASPGDPSAPLYVEKSAAGTSLINLSIDASNVLRLQVKDAVGGSANLLGTGASTMWPGATTNPSAYSLVVARRNGTALDVFKDAGLVISGTAPAGSLSDADIDTRAGNAGTAFAAVGLSRLRVWNVALTDDQVWQLLLTDTPRTRQTAFAFPAAPNSIWTKPLADDAPLHSNSANFITELTRLRGAYAYGPSIGSGGYSVPVFIVGEDTPRVPVRFEGGRTGNAGDDPTALFDAFQSVPIPADAFAASGTDAHMAIYSPRTDEFWEMWNTSRTLLPPAWLTLTDTAGGTLPANTYRYTICTFNANGENTLTRKSANATINSGTCRLSFEGDAVSNSTADPPLLGYRIYRQLKTDTGVSEFLAEIPATLQTFYAYDDDGSVALDPGRTIPYFTAPGRVDAATTIDWACRYGGKMTSVRASKGHYEAPHANWGSTATSIPDWGGLITIEEALAAAAGNPDAIPHAMAMAIPVFEAANTFFYPAQRTDGGSGLANALREGTRFRLPASLDLSTLGMTPLGLAIARAFQKYGGYIRDVSGGVSVCFIEDGTNAGASFESKYLNGNNVFNTQSPFILKNFPWTSMQVVDPAYTQAQTSGGTFTPVPVAQPAGRRRARY